jgi:hypothetical protein
MSNLKTRTDSLVALTGGRPEWYDTRRQIVAAEQKLNVVWDGNQSSHIPAPEFCSGRVIRSEDGSYGVAVHGQRRAAALTRAECERRGLTPGPWNN